MESLTALVPQQVQDEVTIEALFRNRPIVNRDFLHGGNEYTQATLVYPAAGWSSSRHVYLKGEYTDVNGKVVRAWFGPHQAGWSEVDLGVRDRSGVAIEVGDRKMVYYWFFDEHLNQVDEIARRWSFYHNVRLSPHHQIKFSLDNT